jgi:SH3 domain-containing protein
MKLNYIICFLICICIGKSVQANDSLRYVWAVHGLNVRSTPNKSGKIIATIPYGDSVQIVQFTKSAFNMMYVDSLYNGIKPIYLIGNWVKIEYNNLLGFVFEPFLLSIPCARENEILNNYVKRMSERFAYSPLDAEYTVFHGGNPGLMILKGFVTNFPSGKEISFYNEVQNNEIEKDTMMSESNEGYSEGAFLKGFSLQDLLIILNKFYMDERTFRVYENQPNNIRITDNSTQTIDIWLYKDEVIIFSFEDAGC